MLWQNNGMGLPLWALALVVAAGSPMIIRYVADVMEARVRRHTEAIIDDLRRSAPPSNRARAKD